MIHERSLRRMKTKVWRAHYAPKLKKGTALLRKLKDVFRRLQSQAVVKVLRMESRYTISQFEESHAMTI